MNASQRPLPILAIETLGYVGVAVWAVLIVRTWIHDPAAGWWVTIIGVILAAAHVIISTGAARRARIVLPVMWFVLVADALLTVLVDMRALVLVLATVALLLLARTSAARAWWSAPAP